MYTIKEVAKMLNMTDKGIRIRCARLEIKSKIRPLIISEKNFIRIKNYKFLQVFRSSFYFSKDGKYLIINSRLNKETL